MTGHGDRQLDPRWHELQDWTRRLYGELGPDDTPCAVVLLVHGQGGESMTYLTDASGPVRQTVITPDGTYLRVPDSAPVGGAG